MLRNQAACWLLAGVLTACGGGGADTTTSGPSFSITSQPASTTAVAGTAATFRIAAAGSGLSYQWQSSADGGTTWTDIAGATADSYTLASVNVTMNGLQFRVVISGSGGTSTSSPVTLNVTDTATAPVLDVQPAAQTAGSGGSATFSVTASGTSLAYQWQESRDGDVTWVDIAGAASPTLTLTSLTVADNGRRFRVVVSNTAGTLPSVAVTLTVNAVASAPAITVQPSSASVTSPQAATFTVQATGTPAPTCQWQQLASGGSTWAAIAGATACSYTTPSTSLGDSGTQFRAVVTNSAGSITTTPATLTVSAAAVAPTIGTQPQNVAVTVPTTATFTVAAVGTPTPSYQWQLSSDGGATFVNINGATSPSYTTSATVTGDDGKRYRVVVSNLAGSQTSATAVLTVNASDVSPLAGRSWRTGQLIAPGDNPIYYVTSAIDDAGNVTVAFARSDGTRRVRYAARATPNAAGTAPTWSAPVALDLPDDPVASTLQFWAPKVHAVVAAPGGDVAVMWDRAEACNANTYQTTGACLSAYVTRYRAATSSWDAPVQIAGALADSSGIFGTLSINDHGDMLLVGSGWTRTTTSPGYAAKPAVFMRAAGDTAFRQQQLTGLSISNWQVRMDNQGQLLMAANYSQNGTTDIAAFRGSVASGLSFTPTVLDTRASPASLQLVELGLNGQQAIVWSQNNGVRDTWYSAVATSASADFAVVDIGAAMSTTLFPDGRCRMFVTDGGDILIYDLLTQSRLRHAAGGSWSAVQPIPGLAGLARRVGFNRRGDYVQLTTAANNGINEIGYTKAYDGLRNVALPDPGYVLGTVTANNPSNPYFYLYSSAYNDPLVSAGGVAFQSILWNFDVLPTPSLPAGDGRNSVTNLWGVFLK